jgi:3-oxoacyl-[acyl-carrier-protein] synthase-3
MPKSVFRGVRISGVAGAVPRNTVDNMRDHVFCSEEDRKKIVALTKVETYRKAPPEMCASDLCQAAAESLLASLGRTAADIDAIVFSTMTPDYRVPSTACLLQDRLGCPTTVAAYDVNMGCSGFVVGLYNACSLVNGAGLRRVLLLAGDTQTKLCYDQDKNVVFILADGGTATLVEADPGGGDIAVELMTDGGRFKNLYIPAGGFRNPSTAATREVKVHADGGMRSDDNIFMNGMEIFKFSATDVVKTLSGFMETQGLSPQTVDGLFLHQANHFMNEKIARKLQFAPQQVPYTIGFYGNTGSASIPLTMAHHLSTTGSDGTRRALMCGFGVGLSWGVASAELKDVCAPPVIEL